MNNENTSIKRENITNSAVKTDNDLSAGGGSIANERPHGEVLGQAAQGGGVGNQEATQPQADRPNTSSKLPIGTPALTWGVSIPWNKALEEINDRPMEPRAKLWASELGKSPVDLFLKLKGTPLTNPPNARSRRKFEAGNLFEWIVGLVLRRAGILQESQKWVMYQYEGLLPVSGKADYMAGGIPQTDKAKEMLDKMQLPEMFYKGFNQVLEYLQKEYPYGLAIKPLEIKSISSFMMDSLERTDKALKMHRLQAFHYLKSQGLPSANIVYICRDDCRMKEVSVGLETEAEYKHEIEVISGYYKRDEMPPLEKLIVWDEDMAKFTRNFNVGYSGYLTKLYGFKDQKEYEDIYLKMATSWNRVMKRVKDNAKMTPKNEEILVAIRKEGFNVEELAAKMPNTPVEEEELPA